jgi:thiamine-phosphate pyrophosphorylase
MRSDAEILWEVASGLAREAAKVSRPGRAPPPLLFFTDPARTPRPWETAARLPSGAGVVFRHFGAPDALETARRLRAATSARDGVLLIGLDADLAETVGADGVHLPEQALGQAEALRSARPGWLLTGAAHSEAVLSDADALDAVVVSPVLPAGGASAGRPALGLRVFRSLVRAASRPVYALGGLDARNAQDLIGSGACGLAGVSAIQAAFGPS